MIDLKGTSGTVASVACVALIIFASAAAIWALARRRSRDS